MLRLVPLSISDLHLDKLPRWPEQILHRLQFGISTVRPSRQIHLYITKTLKAPPQEEWLFLPPTGNNQQSNTSAGFSNNAPTNSSSLGSGPTSTLAGVELDPTDPEESLTFSDIAQLFASEFLTTAMGMPFEVGKTLLQVEYKPKEGVTAGTVDEVVVDARGDLTDEESVIDENEGQSARLRNVEASVGPFLLHASFKADSF